VASSSRKRGMTACREFPTDSVEQPGTMQQSGKLRHPRARGQREYVNGEPLRQEATDVTGLLAACQWLLKHVGRGALCW
jgi:hypothetical protein